MKRLKKILIGLIVFAIGILLLTIIRVQPNETKIGTHCGMCIARCFDVYRLTDGGIEIDSISGYEGVYGSKEFDFKPFFKDENYKSELSVPAILFLMPSWTFGCPDCYDQCGYYIEFSQFGIRKKFKIDPDKVPFYLDKTVHELTEEINKANEG